jgi:hypothetical protein
VSNLKDTWWLNLSNVQLLISLLSFFLPTQLALHLNNFNSTVYGFQIDYLIPTIYLTDIIAFFIILLGLRKIKFSRKYLVLSALYIIFVLTNILVSDYFISSAYKWIKVTEMLLLGIVILNYKKFDVFKNFVKPLSYSILIACILGIWQFLIKSSVGGLFYWLGERGFLFSNPNIAPYPYSFFSHPNSFAGFLLVYGIFLLQFKNKFKPRYFWTLLALIVINLILTNSLNVYITICLLLIITLKKFSVLSFVLIDFSERYITHRIELIRASLQLIKENFWFGVGLNNFIPNLVKVSNTFINAWELQPVHNIFLLVFSETGIVGFLAFIYLIANSYLAEASFAYQLIAVLFTGLSDHYWLTLQQNMLLFVFVLVTSRIGKIKHTV